MTPALFVEFGLKTFRHPRCCIIVAGVVPWARSSGATASTGALAFPGSIRVSFTNQPQSSQSEHFMPAYFIYRTATLA